MNDRLRKSARNYWAMVRALPPLRPDSRRTDGSLEVLAYRYLLDAEYGKKVVREAINEER